MWKWSTGIQQLEIQKSSKLLQADQKNTFSGPFTLL